MLDRGGLTLYPLSFPYAPVCCVELIQVSGTSARDRAPSQASWSVLVHYEMLHHTLMLYMPTRTELMHALSSI